MDNAIVGSGGRERSDSHSFKGWSATYAHRNYLADRVGIAPTAARGWNPAGALLDGLLCKVEEGKRIELLQPFGHRRVQTG